MVLNISEECNYNPNLVSNNKILKRFLRAYVVSIAFANILNKSAKISAWLTGVLV